MKRLKFEYQMHLALNNEVIRHSFALRCVPKQTADQCVGGLTCEFRPVTSISRIRDCFDNTVYIGYISEAHDNFSFCISGIVERKSTYLRESLNPLFCYPSHYTELKYPLTAYFPDFVEPEGSGKEKAVYLMELLQESFRYAAGSTNVDTTAEEALQGGCGVCQDYAHIFIAMCRKCKIPARYAAGFMIGEGATHAWAEIYTDGVWIGIDPTNHKLVDELYIKLSVGRDFGDCISDRGIFTGNAVQQQTVSVKVEEVS